MSGSGRRLIAVSEARQSAFCPVASAGGLLRATAPTAPLPVVVLSSVIRGRFALLSPTPCNPEFNYFLLITSSYSWRLLLMLLGYSAVFLPNFLICIPDSGLFIYCQQIITVAGAGIGNYLLTGKQILTATAHKFPSNWSQLPFASLSAI